MPLGKPNIEKLEAKGDVKRLAKAARSSDPQSRREALAALVRLGDASGAPLFEILVMPSSPEVQCEAAAALGEIGGERSVQLLIESFRRRLHEIEPSRSAAWWESHRRVEQAATDALVRIGEPAVEAILAELERSTTAPIEPLGAIGDERAVQPLVELFELRLERSPASGPRRAHVVELLGQFQDARAARAILAATKDDDHMVRDNAKQVYEGLDADLKAEAEKLQWKEEAGLRESVVACSSCGGKLLQHEVTTQADAILGVGLMGNVCVACRNVYCQDCIQVGAPTPCPSCGTPTLPAGRQELARIGIDL